MSEDVWLNVLTEYSQMHRSDGQYYAVLKCGCTVKIVVDSEQFMCVCSAVEVTVAECGLYRRVVVECSALVQTAASKLGISMILSTAARPASLPTHSELVNTAACLSDSCVF